MSSVPNSEPLSDEEPPVPPGTSIGEYETQELLGQGGFGAVYRAVHPVIGKPAAIKILKREYSAKPEMVARFVSEARAVNQIRHRNIIDIFSFGRLPDGRQFFVMELLDGMPLDKYLEVHGRIPVAHALPILRQLSRALGAAHAAGITHRDIKPENVFLTFDDDGQPVPKLLDFGIAKLVVDNFSKHKTRSGVPMGTPLYMSPEQVHGRDVDHRSDIYSFGIMVFEMLTGTVPFGGETMMMVMMKQVSEPAPKPSSVAQGVHPALDGPVCRMLEKEADKRPGSIVEAVEELVRAAGQAGLIAPVSTTPGSLEPLPVAPAGNTRLFAHTPVKPPSEATLAALASHDTLIASESPKHELPAPGAAGNKTRTMLLGALASFLVLGSVAVFFVTRAPATGATSATSATTTPAAATSEQPTTKPEPLVRPEVSATQSAATQSATAQSATIIIKLKSSPEKAEVFHGKNKLGETGDALSFPKGIDQVELVVKKPGYAPLPLKITPTADVVDLVILKPLPKSQSPEYGNF